MKQPVTRLSVNINKVALIRNSRGGNLPDLIRFAIDCEAYGAEGITVHPRPDERHVRFDDVPALRAVVKTELNVEGYPSEKFLRMVETVKPDQCTLVPDPPDALTSSEGWDTIKHRAFLKEVIARLKSSGIRTSLFIETDPAMIEGCVDIGTDRIELYTGPYAHAYSDNPEKAIAPYIAAAKLANQLGLGLNAGHDLNLQNLRYFFLHIPGLLEVSIGHALISDALYYGISNTIQMYLYQLRPREEK